MERQPDSTISADDHTRLVVKYDGPGVYGTMDLAEFIPALEALRETIVLSSQDLNHGAVEPRVLITTETKASSYEFVLVFTQVAQAASNFLNTPDALHSAVEIGKAVFGENGVIGLAKFLFSVGDKDVEKVVLGDGNVQYITRGIGNTVNATTIVNNYYIATSQADRLISKKAIRDGMWPAIKPVTKAGIESVSFTPEGAKPQKVTTSEAKAFEPSPLEKILEDDSWRTHEELVVVIKPSFDAKKTWKLAIGEEEFGALMQDSKFQAQVLRREVLFGKGDQLRVLLAVRRYKSKGKRRKNPEYIVAHVFEVIPPPDAISGPEQLSLGA